MFFVVTEDFTLSISGGEFTDSEIIVMLGENGKIVIVFFVKGRRVENGGTTIPDLQQLLVFV